VQSRVNDMISTGSEKIQVHLCVQQTYILLDNAGIALAIALLCSVHAAVLVGRFAHSVCRMRCLHC